MQNTSRILMIRPLHFMFNAETAVNNRFQVKSDTDNLTEKAVVEFDEFVKALRKEGIDVTVVEDSPDPHTPDAIFPNNWISFHEGGVFCLYPMFAPNRRMERKTEVIDLIRKKFKYQKLVDFTSYELENRFLEGTGSMVLDREQKIAYACLSPRTDSVVLEDFCKELGYTPAVFHAIDETGEAIYDTNVMMCVADRFVVICLDSIPAADEKKRITDRIHTSGKEIISINISQMNHFAGNMLQLENISGEKILVMSSAAWTSLHADQKEKLTRYNHILHMPLENIETNGGGSARCMIAEIHA